MRVLVQDVDEFIEDLKTAHSVHQGTLRFSIIKRKGASPHSAKVQVYIQFGAVVVDAEGNEYLLEGAEPCGDDFVDAEASGEGSAKAVERKQAVIQFASDRGWLVKPGIIGE